MSEPTTESGKRLLDALALGPWTTEEAFRSLIGPHILAIETEARAPLEDEIARLRPIEKAARTLIRAIDMDQGTRFVLAIDRLRDVLEEKS